MRRLVGAVNNGDPWWSEISLGDTLTLGVQAPQIEMSAVSMGGGFSMAAGWHTLTWGPELGATLWGYKEALRLGDLVTGDRRGVFFFFLQKLVKCFQRKIFQFEVNLKFLQANSEVTSK